MLDRRNLLKAGAGALAGLFFPAARPSWAAETVEIHLRSRDNGAFVTFDPIGLLVQPGAKIRWVVEADVHTTTAYHPANDFIFAHTEQRATLGVRLPVNPGDRFEVGNHRSRRLRLFSRTPHEMAGMWAGSSSGNRAAPALYPSTISKPTLRRLPGRKYRNLLAAAFRPSSGSWRARSSALNNEL